MLRNIRLGVVIDGLVRKESYELHLVAIREMIINAHCYRNLTDDSCVDNPGPMTIQSAHSINSLR